MNFFATVGISCFLYNLCSTFIIKVTIICPSRVNDSKDHT